MRGGATSPLLFAACLAGAGTMAIELSAVRLIAPWFGTSQAVWTSAIGAILVALSAGYWVGGRWAAAPHPEKRLAIALWGACAWAVALPSLAPWVAGGLMPESANIEQVATHLPLASLACALVLFLPPAALLATSGPLVVELLVRSSGCPAGRAGGQVLACSTVGSLIGTFGTTYLGIPYAGLSETLWFTASLIAVGALLCTRSSRPHVAAVLALGSAWAFASPAPAPSEGVIAAGESPYQRVRVVELADGWRALEVNERRGSFQSIWSPDPGLLGSGYYYDCFALPPAWGRAEGEWSLLVLGLGAGTAWRVIEGTLPVGCELHATGVELDPMVVSMAQAHMGLSEDQPHRRVLSSWDARAVIASLSREGRRWDHLIVDVYANQFEIPPHLATLEFFQEAKGLLDDGGWMQVNVGAASWDDPLVSAIAATLAAAFDRPTLANEVPFSRNVILTQRLNLPGVRPDSPDFVPEEEALGQLAEKLRLPGTWGLIDVDGGEVLEDGYAPLEALQRKSLALMERPE